MIDVRYNARQNTLPPAQFSNEWQNLCNELEGTLTEKQIELLHAMLDIQSDSLRSLRARQSAFSI